MLNNAGMVTSSSLAKMLENGSTLYAVTHPGIFHADDVFATAFLKMFEDEYFSEKTSGRVGSLKKVVIVRGQVEHIDSPKDICPQAQNMTTSDGYIVFDIGGGRYDHHQADSEVRPASTDEHPLPYAAFGLIWREFAPIVFDEGFVEAFDAEFVQAIDLQDNGVARNPLSATISKMNPAWDSNDAVCTRFSVAVEFAMSVLKFHFDAYFSQKKAEAEIEACLERSPKGTIIMDRYLPADGYLKANRPDVRFKIYPSARDAGRWCVMVLQGSPLLPEEWLVPEKAPAGMTFCHKGLFLASFESKQYAMDGVETIR